MSFGFFGSLNSCCMIIAPCGISKLSNKHDADDREKNLLQSDQIGSKILLQGVAWNREFITSFQCPNANFHKSCLLQTSSNFYGAWIVSLYGFTVKVAVNFDMIVIQLPQWL